MCAYVYLPMRPTYTYGIVYQVSYLSRERYYNIVAL